MNLKELTNKEFDQFTKNEMGHNFFQSSKMKKVFDIEQKENYLLGLEKNGKIVAATLIVARNTFLGKKTFEAVKGFIIDYHDFALVKEFTLEVYRFMESKNGFRLLINPYLPVIERDTDANIVKDGFDNKDIIKNLESIGYISRGAGAQVKWTYCLDFKGLSSDEIFKTFKSNTRNYINRTINKYQLVCKTLSYDELNIFKKITEDTCERRGFGDRTLAYYQDMYQEFGDDVTFKVVYLDCDLYINALETENKNFTDKINELSDSSSNQGKKETMKKDIEANNKKILETKDLRKRYGNLIPLSGAMFMLYGDEIVYLFSGSYKELMSFCGQYRLQWEIIKYGADHNYRRYNFFGINDVFDKNGKDYGVYEFKKGFNGYVEELMDVYEYGKGFKYFLYKLIKKIKK